MKGITCPNCGSNYVAFRDYTENLPGEGRNFFCKSYVCESCRKEIRRNIEKPKGKFEESWLMTLSNGGDSSWHTFREEAFVEVYRTSPTSVSVYQKDGEQLVTGDTSLSIYGDEDRFNYSYLVVSTNVSGKKQFRVSRIKMNKELTKLAMSDNAMRSVWNERLKCFDIRGNHSKALIDDICAFLRKCTGASERKGCYIATAVYGSYDCPQVWTLRRFRDDTLSSTWYGRLFVRTYYAISPTLVRWFGHTGWFKKFWKERLDKMVNNLQMNGVESTPYQDKEW